MFSRSRTKIILSIMGSLILLFVLTLSVIMMASWREIRQRNSDMLKRYVELYSPEPQGDPDVTKPEPESENQGVSEPEPKSEDQGVSKPGPIPEDPGMFGPEPKPEEGALGEPKPESSPGDKGNPGQGEPPEMPRIDDRPDYQLSTFYSVVFLNDDADPVVDNGEKEVYSEEDLIEIAEDVLAGHQLSGRAGSLSYIVDRSHDYTLVAFMDNTVTESSLNTLLRYILIVGGAAIVVLFFISLYLSKRIIRPLEENDRRQKQFISDAGHELKTPVAVIEANAELLSRELGENEWLDNIRYENERMGGLVKQLLDLSRAENQVTVTEKVDLSRAVTGEVLAFESLAFDRGKTIQSDIEEGIILTGSTSQLTQLSSILLDNAIRHSTGSVIELSLKAQAHMAVLIVANEGDEIPADQQEHLFDRFYRIDEARGSEDAHYGLGLSIAKAITRKHHGTISVSCHDGKIWFTVSLPTLRTKRK